MRAKPRLRIPAARCARVIACVASKKERAQGMPGVWLHPQPRVQCRKHTSVVTADEAEHRHSLRGGVNGLCRAHPGETGFCVTVARASQRVGPEGPTSPEAQA